MCPDKSSPEVKVRNSESNINNDVHVPPDIDPKKGLLVLEMLEEKLDGLTPEEKNKKLEQIFQKLKLIKANEEKNHLKRIK
jgi:hypothetical protein